MYHYLATAGHPLPDREAFFQLYRETIVENWRQAKKTWASVNFAQSLRQLFAALKLDLDRIDMDEALAAYDWQPVPEVVLYEDALSILETLRQREYKIGLITNSMLPMWMRDVELRAYGIIDYFDVRITSGDTGYMKPHPAIYRHALASLDASPERAVFVGDRPENDIAGANEAGLVSVLMDPPHLDRDLDGVKPDYTITRLRDLLPILEDLESGQDAS
jgi:putative hydrolase of the HAD superfamily